MALAENTKLLINWLRLLEIDSGTATTIVACCNNPEKVEMMLDYLVESYEANKELTPSTILRKAATI